MAATYLFFSFLIGLSYLYVIVRYISYWKQTPGDSNSDNKVYPTIDVIIPFRNESKHIESLIASLAAQNYSGEVNYFLVNDHSTDQSLTLASLHHGKNFHILNLPDGQEGKKSALMYALNQSQSELILFSDADTTRGKNWISSMVNGLTKGSYDMVTGPVLCPAQYSSSKRYYQLELYAFMVITCGAINGRLHAMANGANMLIRRNKIYGKDPFGQKKSVSGDDLFLAEHFFDQNKLGFVKNTAAIVETFPPNGLELLMRQKVRWASKNTHLKGRTTKMSLLSLALLPIFILMSILMAIFYGWKMIGMGLILLVIKSIGDFFLIRSGANFVGIQIKWTEVLSQQLLNLRLSLGVVLNQLSGNPIRWKGRNAKS